MISLPNTLDIKRLSIYFNLCKALLKNGNLYNEKYEKLFLIYIKYGYDFIKSVYNTNLCDEEILNILKDKEDIFIMKINILQKNKNKDLLKYISNMKNLLNNHRAYKKGIEILIKKFEVEFDESEELINLKKQYKSIVENNIASGKFEESILMIKEYESMFNKDSEILTMKSVVKLYNNNFKEAELLLKEASIIDNYNYNIIFNIGYLKECIEDVDEAIRFYKRIILNCKDKLLLSDTQERIKNLN